MNQTANPTVEERRQRLQGFAKSLASSYLLMDRRRHLLEPLLRDEEIKAVLQARFQNRRGVRAQNMMVPLLGQLLAGDLAKLLLDNDDRTASLTNIFRKASSPDLFKTTREWFIGIPARADSIPVTAGVPEELVQEHIEKWRQADLKKYTELFDRGWTAVSEAKVALDKDPVGEKLKTVRDKYIAHLEMTRLGQEPELFDIGTLGLKYNDLLEFADRYQPAVFELVRIITGGTYMVADFCRIHSSEGNDMWRVLTGQQPAAA